MLRWRYHGITALGSAAPTATEAWPGAPEEIPCNHGDRVGGDLVALRRGRAGQSPVRQHQRGEVRGSYQLKRKVDGGAVTRVRLEKPDERVAGLSVLAAHVVTVRIHGREGVHRQGLTQLSRIFKNLVERLAE